MKSHALFVRWALVIALGLLLLPATDAVAAAGSDAPSFALDYNIRVSTVSSDVDPLPPGDIGTNYGDPDDVGGGEGKDEEDRKKPNPDWERLKAGAGSETTGVIESLWQSLLESARQWLGQ
jgi:hypothetical protein